MSDKKSPRAANNSRMKEYKDETQNELEDDLQIKKWEDPIDHSPRV